MNRSSHSTGSVRFVLCSALIAALTGCTTYVEQRPPRTVYAAPEPPAIVTPAEPPVVVTPTAPPAIVAPAEPEVVVISSETDFYEPLNPYGSWVIVGSYGRCWRPGRVDAGWRPYCDGHWQRTDAGWYWASDEPWGWATYHYGRWDRSVEFGWIWVPATQWAPAWVSWRQGAGYVGWAPLPPSARIGTRGIIEARETAVAPHAFVFVSEQRLLEPVHPTTVIVNNTTVINQTVNITKIQVVNRKVIAEGPRPETIERQSGRKIEAVPVHELRRREETAVVIKQRNIPTHTEPREQRPVVAGSTPAGTIPRRGTGQVGQPATVPAQPQSPARRNEVRGAVTPGSSLTSQRPGAVLSAHDDGTSAVKGRQETKPGTTVPPRETRPAGRPSDASRPAQAPALSHDARGAVEMKSPARPAPSAAAGQMGHERQRGLERATGNSGPQLSTNQPGAKPKTPVKAKSAGNDRVGKPARKQDVKKQGEESQTPERPAPSRPPQ